MSIFKDQCFAFIHIKVFNGFKKDLWIRFGVFYIFNTDDMIKVFFDARILQTAVDDIVFR